MYVTEHVPVPLVPQLIPPPVTVPPVGVVTVSRYVGSAVNVAVQVLALSTVTLVVVLVPEQLPPQPVNE